MINDIQILYIYRNESYENEKCRKSYLYDLHNQFEIHLGSPLKSGENYSLVHENVLRSKTKFKWQEGK